MFPGLSAYLVYHADNEALLLDLVVLERVFILEDLACGLFSGAPRVLSWFGAHQSRSASEPWDPIPSPRRFSASQQTPVTSPC